jgi:hypothetical protein
MNKAICTIDDLTKLGISPSDVKALALRHGMPLPALKNGIAAPLLMLLLTERVLTQLAVGERAADTVLRYYQTQLAEIGVTLYAAYEANAQTVPMATLEIVDGRYVALSQIGADGKPNDEAIKPFDLAEVGPADVVQLPTVVTSVMLPALFLRALQELLQPGSAPSEETGPIDFQSDLASAPAPSNPAPQAPPAAASKNSPSPQR